MRRSGSSNRSTWPTPSARGVQLREGLRGLAAEHPFIRDVRGLGLMVGMEVGHDDGPDPDLRDRIIQHAFRRGLLLLPCGASTVRFCPPLCLTRRQVEMGLEILGRVLAEVAVVPETAEGRA